MANPFDQFDGGPTPAAPAPADRYPPPGISAPIAAYSMKGSNPFDQFDGGGGPSAEPQASIGSLGLNAASGFNEHLARLIGAPVDVATNILNQLRRSSNQMQQDMPAAFRSSLMGRGDLPPIEHPFGGSESVAQGMASLGVDPSQFPATNAPERAARAAGGAAADTLGMVTGARLAAPLVPATAPVVRGSLQTLGSAPPLATTVAGGVGGATGNVAAAQVPDEYAQFRPLVDEAGNIIGGGGAALGLHAGGAALTGGYNAARNAIAPLTAAGRERLAGETLARNATDLGAARAALNDAENGGQIAPGLGQPTTGQLTGDEGLLSLQNKMAARSQAAFAERANQQDAARAAYAEGTAPAGSQSGDLSAAIMARYGAEDEATKAALDSAVSRAAAKTRALGGEVTTDDNGATIRSELANARLVAKGRENKAWDAIEANGVKAIDVDPSRQAVKSVLDDIPEDATQPSGQEADIYQKILAWPKVRDFRNFQAVRSDLLAAMAQERATNGISPAYRRMAEVERGLFNNIGSQAMAAEAAAARPGANSSAPVNAPTAGDFIYTPSGRKVGIRHEIVEGNTLVPSHDQDLRPNPNFPPSLQPRDRTRIASDTQIKSMSQNLQPERLATSPDAMSGAPVVGPDGIVESGNARTLAILDAYRTGGPSATAYRDFLNQRFNTEGFENPVLIRRRTTDLSPAERVKFVQEANANPGLSLSATERATQDAARITPDTMGLYKGGDITSAENRPFVLSLMKSIPERGEEGGMVTAGNTLSLEGQRRLENALLAKAYPDSHVVSQLAETGDEAGKSFANAMKAAAPTMGLLRVGIDHGIVPPQFDIAKGLTEAAELVAKARASKTPLKDMVAQQDAFASVHPMRDNILRSAFGDDFSGRLNQARFADVLRFYADEAAKQSTQAQLFASTVTPEAILQAGAARRGKAFTPSTSSATAPGPTQGMGGGRGESGPAPSGYGIGEAGSSAPGQTPNGRNTGILQGPPLTENWTAEDAAAYRNARALTRERAQTFDKGAVGKALAQRGYDVYTLADSQVPARFFNSGARASQDAQDFLRAAGDRPTAVAALHDYAAVSLIKSAGRSDGTLDPAKFSTWAARHSEALRAFPELQAKFADAAAANDAIAEATAARKQFTDTYSKGIASRFLGGADPTRAIEGALGSKNAVPAVRELAGMVRGNPDAAGGLQRAAIDLLSRRSGDFSNAAGLQTYVARNRAALSEIFSPEQMGRLDSIVADAARARITVPASKGVPPKFNLLERWMIYETLGGAAEHLSNHAGHGLGYVVPPLYVGLTHLRKIGFERVNDLVTEAMLHPEIARTLLAKVPDAEAPALAKKLGAQMAALTLNAGLQASGPQPSAAPSAPAPAQPAPGPVYWGPSGGVFGPGLLSGTR